MFRSPPISGRSVTSLPAAGPAAAPEMLPPENGPTIRPRGGVSLNAPPVGGPPCVIQRMWIFDRARGRARWVGPGPHPGTAPAGFEDVTHLEESQDTDADWRPEHELSLFPPHGRQDHLIAAPGAGGAPTLATTAYHRQYGEQALAGASSSSVASVWREPQIQRPMGGSGFDETLQTRVADDLLDDPANHPLAARLSESREPVTNLTWATAPGRMRPIGGHPGAMTSTPGDMRHGVTEEHNTRDRIRGRFVTRQLGGSATPSAGEVDDAVLMSRIMTSQVMSQPGAQLHAAPRPAPGTVFHAIYGDMADPSSYDHAAANTHNARERRKLEDAERLMRRGHVDLVAPEMQGLLRHHGSAPEAAYNLARYSPQSHDPGPPASQAYVPAPDHPPVTLAEWNARVSAPHHMPRAVSPPRGFITRARPPSHAPKPLRQPRLDELWDDP